MAFSNAPAETYHGFLLEEPTPKGERDLFAQAVCFPRNAATPRALLLLVLRARLLEKIEGEVTLMPAWSLATRQLYSW